MSILARIETVIAKDHSKHLSQETLQNRNTEELQFIFSEDSFYPGSYILKKLLDRATKKLVKKKAEKVLM